MGSLRANLGAPQGPRDGQRSLPPAIAKCAMQNRRLEGWLAGNPSSGAQPPKNGAFINTHSQFNHGTIFSLEKTFRKSPKQTQQRHFQLSDTAQMRFLPQPQLKGMKYRANKLTSSGHKGLVISVGAKELETTKLGRA